MPMTWETNISVLDDRIYISLHSAMSLILGEVVIKLMPVYHKKETNYRLVIPNFDLYKYQWP